MGALVLLVLVVVLMLSLPRWVLGLLALVAALRCFGGALEGWQLMRGPARDVSGDLQVGVTGLAAFYLIGGVVWLLLAFALFFGSGGR